MKRRTFFKNTLINSIGIMLASPLACKRFGSNTWPFSVDFGEIEKIFFLPPGSAKPQVWWCWVDGHITKDCITSDLEAMKRVGMRGFQLLEFSDKTVDQGPIIYGSPEHFQMLQHTAKEA